MRFTVLGAAGFLGAAVARHLAAEGHEVQPALRTSPATPPLGHVVDCVGITADFRTRPLDTMDAHVSRLTGLLRASTFDSFLYLSSTRVYARCEEAGEDTPLPVLPGHADDLYAISKLAGEVLCLSDPRPSVRVARLSNVIGPGADPATFLANVITDARSHGEVTLGIDPRSERDFIWLDDVVDVLPRIAVGGQHRLYNVASGQNRSAGDVLDQVCRLTGATWHATSGAPLTTFPAIATDRVRDEFAFTPTTFEDVLPSLVRFDGSLR